MFHHQRSLKNNCSRQVTIIPKLDISLTKPPFGGTEVAIIFPDSFWVPAIVPLSFLLGLLAPQKSFRMFMDWKKILGCPWKLVTG